MVDMQSAKNQADKRHWNTMILCKKLIESNQIRLFEDQIGKLNLNEAGPELLAVG
jgi:hypothetical protein